MKKAYLLLVLFLISGASKAEVFGFWPRIPFNIIGANLCEFRAAYSQTRSQYIQEMVDNAKILLEAGDFDPVKTLTAFNQMYERNLVYARRGLGVTLENSFKSQLDSLYRETRAKVKKLEFRHTNKIDTIINAAINGHQITYLNQNDVNQIDLFAYGSYSMSPNCNGNIIVTLSIIGKNGVANYYSAQGQPHLVMRNIAVQVFEDFQRTSFPSKLKMHNKTLTLLGGINENIDITTNLNEVENICQALGGRLPTEQEYKFIDSYGSWSGGISLGDKTWAMNWPNVYHAPFKRYPVRPYSQVNAKEYYYICVK